MIGKPPIKKQSDEHALGRILNHLNSGATRNTRISGGNGIEVCEWAGGYTISQKYNTVGIPFKNLSGEICPAYSIIRIDGVLNDKDRTLKGRKPDTTLYALYAVNSGSSVAANAIGTCFLDGIAKIKYTGDDPAYDSVYGVDNNSWVATAKMPGWKMLGAYDSENKIALCVLSPIKVVCGKLAENLEVDGSAEVTIYDDDGDETDLSVTAYDWVGVAQSEGTKVFCVWVTNDWWVISGGGALIRATLKEELKSGSTADALIQGAEENISVSDYLLPSTYSIPTETPVFLTTIEGVYWVVAWMPTAVEPYTDFQVSGNDLQFKKTPILTPAKLDETTWATKHTGTNCEES